MTVYMAQPRLIEVVNVREWHVQRGPEVGDSASDAAWGTHTSMMVSMASLLARSTRSVASQQRRMGPSTPATPIPSTTSRVSLSTSGKSALDSSSELADACYNLTASHDKQRTPTDPSTRT